MSDTDSAMGTIEALVVDPGIEPIRKEVIRAMDANVEFWGRRREFDEALRIAERKPLDSLTDAISANGLLPKGFRLFSEFRYKPGNGNYGDITSDSATARKEFIDKAGVGSTNRVTILPQLGAQPATLTRDVWIERSDGGQSFPVQLTPNMYTGRTDDISFTMTFDQSGSVSQLTINDDPVNSQQSTFMFDRDGKILSTTSSGSGRVLTPEENATRLAYFSDSYKIDPQTQDLDIAATGAKIVDMGLNLEQPVIIGLIPMAGIPKQAGPSV